MSLYWAGRAERFDRNNPEVYRLLVKYARYARLKGVDRIGIEMLWNRMRWDRLVVTAHPGDNFKLNQNFKAWYARRIMELEPDLAGIFATRQRTNG